MSEAERVGEVTHYFTDIGVASVVLDSHLQVGDSVSIEGATTDFEQTVESMQLDHVDVEEAGPGDEVGIKVDRRVREGDEVKRTG
ncbi:MAG: hypothetical protein MAG715_00288 [Methanonatronarchaeales archaeon]|nr:hypothetical protein [Methanonatronarchaeales archaeon]